MSWECHCEQAVERGAEHRPGSNVCCPYCGKTREHVEALDKVNALEVQLAEERAALDIALGRPTTESRPELFLGPDGLSTLPAPSTTWGRRDGAGTPVEIVAVESDFIAFRTSGSVYAAVHTLPSTLFLRDFIQL